MNSSSRTPLIAAVLVAAAVCTSSNALAQSGTWSELFPTASPPGTAGNDLVSDGTRALSFGGKEAGASLQNKVWAFDGSNWADISPTSGSTPTARKDGAVVWDSGRGRLVVFGGTDSTGRVNDTWEWDGASWTQMSPTTSPPALNSVDMIYVPGLGKTYLFGGSDGTQVFSDTWEWDGTNWTLLSTTTTPPARRNAFMACDTVNNTVVMYGGLDTSSASSTPLNDTWAFDGTDWAQVTTTNFPTQFGTSGLYNGAMCYDPLNQRTVLFGGVETGGTLPHTWEFDGSDWTNLNIPGPGDRQAVSMIFVNGLGRVILFGGYRTSQQNDTWEFVGPVQNSGAEYCAETSYTCPCFVVSSAGEGCPNTTGAGATLAGAGEASIGASSFSLTATQLPNTVGLFVQGVNAIGGVDGNPVGEGRLCLGPQKRYQPQAIAGGTVSRSNFQSFATAGSAMNYQFWYRDPANTCAGGGFNFSPAWNVTWMP